MFANFVPILSSGVEVFRQTYRAIGLGWIFDITNMPIIGKAADALYDIWAENRLRITGRGDMADILKYDENILLSPSHYECRTAIKPSQSIAKPYTNRTTSIQAN